MAQNGTRATGPRCIALVGPFQSGKTTLMEAILARTGAVQRQGTVEAGTTVGDGSKEARHHLMSVELSVATTTFMGESFTFVDCPGLCAGFGKLNLSLTRNACPAAIRTWQVIVHVTVHGRRVH